MTPNVLTETRYHQTTLTQPNPFSKITFPIVKKSLYNNASACCVIRDRALLSAINTSGLHYLRNMSQETSVECPNSAGVPNLHNPHLA